MDIAQDRQTYPIQDQSSLLKRLFRISSINRECFINDLWEFIAFQTVSANEDHRDEMWEASDWLLKRLIALDVVAFAEDMGRQVITDSYRTVKMPKTIIGVLTQSPGKPTILVYGHMDVEDANKANGWQTEPFILSERDEFLFGRGVVNGKGPLLCWLHAIQLYKDAGIRLPINIVFIIEGMANCNSLGLEDVIRNRISFFREVSCVCICDRRWLTNKTPSIIYGTRGLVYYHLEVECANYNVISYSHGGALYEALPDLFYLLSTLVSPINQILVDGLQTFYEVDPKTLAVDYNIWGMSQNINLMALPNDGRKRAALNANWAKPHISIHGIEGANLISDTNFNIPHRVIGKFSIALPPNQLAEEVTQRLSEHLGKVWQERGSPNKMVLCEKFSIPSWTAKCNTREFKAAVHANFDVHEVVPSIVRDGGAMLAPTIFERCLGKNVVVMPIAQNDGCHGPTNERISVDNFLQGSQMLAAFMYEYSLKNKDSLIKEDSLPTA